MATEYVYGWYHYADGTDKEFRYPADNESDLKQNGKAVTVEVKVAGAWDKRKGTVNYSGGNFVVTPR